MYYLLFMLLQLSQFFPLHLLRPIHPNIHSQSPHCCPCLWVIHTCSLSSPFLFFPLLSPSFPLWSLLVCSMFPCRWFYFAHQFILFISSLLQVRSYGICLHRLAYFTQHDSLQFHPCCWKTQEFLLSFCFVVFHCINAPQCFQPLIY